MILSTGNIFITSSSPLGTQEDSRTQGAATPVMSGSSKTPHRNHPRRGPRQDGGEAIGVGVPPPPPPVAVMTPRQVLSPGAPLPDRGRPVAPVDTPAAGASTADAVTDATVGAATPNGATPRPPADRRRLYTPAHFTLAKNADLHMEPGLGRDAFSPNTIRMTNSLEQLLDDDDETGGDGGGGGGGVGGGGLVDNAPAEYDDDAEEVASRSSAGLTVPPGLSPVRRGLNVGGSVGGAASAPLPSRPPPALTRPRCSAPPSPCRRTVPSRPAAA